MYLSETPIINNIQTNSEEINEEIKTLKETAPGPDKISNSTIKRLPPKMINNLTKIFNLCLKHCYFPKCWKVSKIITVPKPGKDPSNPLNLRPICLLNN